MKNTLSKIAIFAVGAAIGSAVTYKYLKTKYDNILAEEIESMKEYYLEKTENTEEDICDDEAEEPAPETNVINKSIREYAAIVEGNGYSNSKDFEEKDDKMEKPYVIAPHEYGEYADYEMITLTYYVDGILADDMDEIIEDVDDTVGADFMNQYGVYEEDTVFVRNDKLMCDYEIQRDWRTYSEVVDGYPHQAEVE